jgi:hypothetical protein
MIVVLSIIGALIARFEAYGVAIVLAGSGLSAAVVGGARRNIGLSAGGLLCCFLVGVFARSYCVRDGHKTIPLIFIVIDAGSQRAIVGADVRLRENEFLPRTEALPGEKGASRTSASDGSVVFVRDFPTSGREGTWRHNENVYFGIGDHLWIQTSAAGYSTQLVSLESLAGKSRDISDSVPPPMRISLVPETVNH